MEDNIEQGMPVEQKLLVIVLDFFVIAELFLGMYVASHDPANLTSLFCKTFFSLLLPTLGIFWIAKRRIGAYLQRQTAQE